VSERPRRRCAAAASRARSGQNQSMAVGWAQDGAVQDQIDATVDSEVARARSLTVRETERSHGGRMSLPIWRRRSALAAAARWGYHQTPGTSRLVRRMYARYPSPNCSAIILSSAPMRSAQTRVNAIR
jgi:hypothetical protein